MFIATLALAIVAVFIGALPMPAADSTNTLDKIVRYIVENRVWILIGWTFVMSLPALASMLREHKYQKIQAQPVINQKIISGREGEFTWIKATSSFASMFGLEPVSESSGRIWEGFTAGVLRQSDQIGIYKLQIYGSDSGLGHYIWMGGTIPSDVTDSGEGHVPFVFGPDDSLKEHFIVDFASARASRQLKRYCRPLKISYDDHTDAVDIYDPETGRDVYVNRDKSSFADKFLFGPYPVAHSPYVIDPGVFISGVSDSDDVKRLICVVRDVYGNPLDHACVSIDSESGYSYNQYFMREMSDKGLVMNIPYLLSQVDVTVSRGGYETLSLTGVPLTPDVLRVEAVLEPQRKA